MQSLCDSVSQTSAAGVRQIPNSFSPFRADLALGRCRYHSYQRHPSFQIPTDTSLPWNLVLPPTDSRPICLPSNSVQNHQEQYPATTLMKDDNAPASTDIPNGHVLVEVQPDWLSATSKGLNPPAHCPPLDIQNASR